VRGSQVYLTVVGGMHRVVALAGNSKIASRLVTTASSGWSYFVPGRLVCIVESSMRRPESPCHRRGRSRGSSPLWCWWLLWLLLLLLGIDGCRGLTVVEVSRSRSESRKTTKDRWCYIDMDGGREKNISRTVMNHTAHGRRMAQADALMP